MSSCLRTGDLEQETLCTGNRLLTVRDDGLLDSGVGTVSIVLLLLRDVTAVTDRCLLRHLLVTGDVVGGVTSCIVARNRGRRHVTSTEALLSNGCVYRAVPEQRPSYLIKLFRLSADMPQYRFTLNAMIKMCSGA